MTSTSPTTSAPTPPAGSRPPDPLLTAPLLPTLLRFALPNMLLQPNDGKFHMRGAKIGKFVNLFNNFKKQMFRHQEKNWLNQFS